MDDAAMIRAAGEAIVTVAVLYWVFRVGVELVKGISSKKRQIRE